MDHFLSASFDPGLNATWIIGGMAVAITALAGALAAVAAKLYFDLKETRKELAECQAARIESSEEHARELFVLKSMIEGRRRKP